MMLLLGVESGSDKYSFVCVGNKYVIIEFIWE